MSAVKRACLLLSICLCLSLGGCSVLELKAETTSGGPNLDLLYMPPYEDNAADPTAQAGEATAMRVDLWLGASRLMGGICVNESTMYPRMSRRYREGGFHYRYKNEVGLYDEVLKELLATAEGSFTRILRFGDERLPDGVIAEAGLAALDDAEALRSARRDLLTYAVSPMPSIFDEFSGESMKDSYYSLGTPKLDQTARFAATGGAELETPGRVSQMSALLQAQIAAIAAGSTRGLTAEGDDDWPLLYALNSIDLTRLSVITFDPAEMRRLSDTDASGATQRYIEEALKARGVFDAGLSAALYYLRLDYMGQMSSFGAADFAEPLIWGKLNYSDTKKNSVGALPMPRVMLMLLIGSPEHVSSYSEALNRRFDANADLKALRGPEKGELTYTAEGRTVTQQPFGFGYGCMTVERPRVAALTQHSEGVNATAPDGSEARQRNGQTTVFISPEEHDGAISVVFPLSPPEGSVSLDLAALENARAEVTDSLLLSATTPNTADAEPPEADGAQAITVRDTVYVFERHKSPFADAPDESPFALRSLKPSADGGSLEAVIDVSGERLREGYYRLLLAADLSGRQLSWAKTDWVDGSASIGVALTNAQIAEWEAFASLIAERQKGNISAQFRHAWGPASERDYYGAPYPDFPPVYGAPGLAELVSQLRAAANLDTIAYVRYVFDAFVSNEATPE